LLQRNEELVKRHPWGHKNKKNAYLEHITFNKDEHIFLQSMSFSYNFLMKSFSLSDIATVSMELLNYQLLYPALHRGTVSLGITRHSLSTGFTNMCPSSAGRGLFSHNIRVSLVPRLTAMSPSSSLMPARDAGLSPVKATTLQSGENPKRSTKN
jgi:hypothetical protein